MTKFVETINNTITTLQNGDNKPITPDKTNSDKITLFLKRLGLYDEQMIINNVYVALPCKTYYRDCFFFRMKFEEPIPSVITIDLIPRRADDDIGKYEYLRKMYRFYYDFVPETLIYDNDDTKFVEQIATYIAKHRLSFTV